jgi:RNA polymerase sigma factor FliA
MSAALRERARAPRESATGELERRDALIAQYQPYVHKVARSVATALSVRANVDDLAGWGYLGLIEAANRFDPSRGVSFRTFAHSRIRGAVLDGLRLEFGGSPGAAQKWNRYARGLTSPNDVCGDAAYAAGNACAAEGPSEGIHHAFDTPDRCLWLAELRGRLEDALAVLTPLERELVEHRYVRDLPLQAFAAERRMSKSWFSRLHKRALGKMRAHLLRGSAPRRGSK